MARKRNFSHTYPSKKAQGALEYLITYGWAILIIVIIGGALFALGVFNPSSWVSNKRATGFTAIQIKDWAFMGTTPTQTVNQLIFRFQNKAGYPIYLWGVNSTGADDCTTTFVNTLIQDEEVVPVQLWCSTGNVEKGKAYTINMLFYYEANGLNHTDYGTLAGKSE
jgi:hypothetical protein